MAWYRRSKLGWVIFRNISDSKHPMNFGKVLTCLDVGFKKNSWLKYYAVMGVAAAAVYSSNLETIPYSKRTHLLLVPVELEKALADIKLRCFIKKHEGKVLPATHPTSLRVGLIAKNLIEALHRDMIRGGYNDKSLEHFNWEVFVVDDPSLGIATSFGAGKIVLSTGCLTYLNSDAKIATVIGHEVACIVARHDAEKLTKWGRFFVLEALLDMCFGETAMHNRILSLFVKFPLCRKLELEADYIGLLLMASAGYHPHVAVTLWQKSAAYLADSNSYWAGFFEEHPSPKKRVQILCQAQDEAMNFYRKSLSI